MPEQHFTSYGSNSRLQSHSFKSLLTGCSSQSPWTSPKPRPPQGNSLIDWLLQIVCWQAGLEVYEHSSAGFENLSAGLWTLTCRVINTYLQCYEHSTAGVRTLICTVMNTHLQCFEHSSAELWTLNWRVIKDIMHCYEHLSAGLWTHLRPLCFK